MKKQIRAIAAIAATTMLLTGCAAHQEDNILEQTPTTQARSSTASSVSAETKQAGENWSLLDHLPENGQRGQSPPQLQPTRTAIFLLEGIRSTMLIGQRAFLWMEHLISTV